jgi:hypothetical protein
MISKESVKVAKCPLGCGKGHLVNISYHYEPYVGFMALRSSARSTTEVRRIRVTCPEGKGVFILPVTVPDNADPISVDSVTNI